MKTLGTIMAFLSLLALPLWAGTTGKIAGQVIDKSSGEPLPGANVLIEGTYLGASTDGEGYFIILNIPPGTYTVQAEMIGYAAKAVTDARVRIDQTTNINFNLSEESVAGEEVVVVAEREVVKDDVSTSVASVSGDEALELPVTSVNQVVNLQAGVEDGLVIRGGGSDEALFLVDGVTFRDPRNNQPVTGIALSAVQEISLERGGFNAEYGQVRSGIVNVVTKEGSTNKYEASFGVKYSEPRRKHFGVSPFDPNSMWLRPYLDPEVAFTGTESGAWDKHTQRQYPSFVGWNEISRQLIFDDENPDNDLSPAAAQRLFMWQHRKQEITDQPDYEIDAGFGGPVPGIGKALGNMRFFTSYRGIREMLMIPLTRDDFREYNWNLKLTSNISPEMKLSFSTNVGKSYNIAVNGTEQRSSTDYIRSPWQIANQVALFPFTSSSRVFSNSYYSEAVVDHQSFALQFTHVLSPNTFYDAKLEHFARDYQTGPTDLRSDAQIEIAPGVFADEAPVGWSPLPTTGIGDGILFGGHTSTARDSSKVSTTSFKMDLTSQINRFNQIKTGVELVYSDLGFDFGTVNLTFPESNTYVNWSKFPLRGAFYVQDKLETKGFIANLGLRLDYSNANTSWINVDPFNRNFYSANFNPAEAFDQNDSESKWSLSPRLGISHPITENSKLFFNYGHFNQLPTYEQLYQLSRGAQNQVKLIGNPSLELAKTVSYELGYDHSLFNNYLIQLAAFYHDITNQQDFTEYFSASGGAAFSYTGVNNNSYEDIRAFELTLRKITGRWWRGFGTYTYQITTSGRFGKAKIFEDPSEQLNYDLDTENQYQFRPRARPRANLTLLLNTPKDFGPELLGGRLFEKWNLAFTARWQSGVYDTWPIINPQELENIQRKGLTFTALRLSKNFSIGKIADISFFADVNNVFNSKNLSFVGFYDFNDLLDYYNSLHLPESDDYNNIPGDDRPGDFRDEDIAFQPIELFSTLENLQTLTDPDPNVIYWVRDSGQYLNYVNNEWTAVESGRIDQVIENKAYIDMPNMTSFNFLSPREIFFGIRTNFNF